MKDPTALAYVNMYAILGAIPLLCRLDEQAAALIRNEKVSVGFSVRGGPAATLVFSDGTCTLRDGVQGASIRLPFSSPEKFNGMIDGTVTPIPSRGFTRIGFLLRKFIPEPYTLIVKPEPHDHLSSGLRLLQSHDHLIVTVPDGRFLAPYRLPGLVGFAPAHIDDLEPVIKRNRLSDMSTLDLLSEFEPWQLPAQFQPHRTRKDGILILEIEPPARFSPFGDCKLKGDIAVR